MFRLRHVSVMVSDIRCVGRGKDDGLELSAQRNQPFCVLVCYAVFHKLFCMKKDDFLPIFWRCKTIFVTLHHQTRAVMPGAAGTGAG